MTKPALDDDNKRLARLRYAGVIAYARKLIAESRVFGETARLLVDHTIARWESLRRKDNP